MQNFKELIAQTKAFIFDVDGVMTDGGIMPIEGGTDFIRKYNAKDGYAIAYAIRWAKEHPYGSILATCSGRGDKDVDYVVEHYGYGDDREY